MSEHILEVKNLCKYFYLGKNKPPMKAVDDVSFYICLLYTSPSPRDA